MQDSRGQDESMGAGWAPSGAHGVASISGPVATAPAAPPAGDQPAQAGPGGSTPLSAAAAAAAAGGLAMAGAVGAASAFDGGSRDEPAAAGPALGRLPSGSLGQGDAPALGRVMSGGLGSSGSNEVTPEAMQLRRAITRQRTQMLEEQARLAAEQARLAKMQEELMTMEDELMTRSNSSVVETPLMLPTSLKGQPLYAGALQGTTGSPMDPHKGQASHADTPQGMEYGPKDTMYLKGQSSYADALRGSATGPAGHPQFQQQLQQQQVGAGMGGGPPRSMGGMGLAGRMGPGMHDIIHGPHGDADAGDDLIPAVYPSERLHQQQQGAPPHRPGLQDVGVYHALAADQPAGSPNPYRPLQAADDAAVHSLATGKAGTSTIGSAGVPGTAGSMAYGKEPALTWVASGVGGAAAGPAGPKRRFLRDRSGDMEPAATKAGAMGPHGTGPAAQGMQGASGFGVPGDDGAAGGAAAGAGSAGLPEPDMGPSLGALLGSDMGPGMAQPAGSSARPSASVTAAAAAAAAAAGGGLAVAAAGQKQGRAGAESWDEGTGNQADPGPGPGMDQGPHGTADAMPCDTSAEGGQYGSAGAAHHDQPGVRYGGTGGARAGAPDVHDAEEDEGFVDARDDVVAPLGDSVAPGHHPSYAQASGATTGQQGGMAPAAGTGFSARVGVPAAEPAAFGSYHHPSAPATGMEPRTNSPHGVLHSQGSIGAATGTRPSSQGSPGSPTPPSPRSRGLLVSQRIAALSNRRSTDDSVGSAASPRSLGAAVIPGSSAYATSAGIGTWTGAGTGGDAGLSNSAAVGAGLGGMGATAAVLGAGVTHGDGSMEGDRQAAVLPLPVGSASMPPRPTTAPTSTGDDPVRMQGQSGFVKALSSRFQSGGPPLSPSVSGASPYLPNAARSSNTPRNLAVGTAAPGGVMGAGTAALVSPLVSLGRTLSDQESLVGLPRDDNIDTDVGPGDQQTELLEVKMAPEQRAASASSLPDLSAALKAKVAASFEEQADPEKLRAIYDKMAEKLFFEGLDLEAIRSQSVYFHDVDPSSAVPPTPLSYADFPGIPLPSGSVRLSVLYQDDFAVNEPFYKAARAIAACLPPGTKVYLNRPEHYHLTVFMTSQPHDCRPNPFDPAQGGWDAAKPNPVPPADVAEKEFGVVQRLAAALEKPELEVYKLVLTNTGTLLLCCTERTGAVATLRSQFQAAFPGAPDRQSTILHMSLFRILTPEPMDFMARSAVNEEITRWNAKLGGVVFTPDFLWHVHEEEFTTVQGPRRKFPFSNAILD